MSRGRNWKRWVQTTILVLATGGYAFQIAGDCDPQIRSTIFGGFQSLATSFLDAFFIGLQQRDTNIVTVRVNTSADRNLQG
jgi:hypothetical protein